MNKRKARVGSSFDDFLKEEGLLVGVGRLVADRSAAVAAQFASDRR